MVQAGLAEYQYWEEAGRHNRRKDAQVRNLAARHCRRKHAEVYENEIQVGPGSEDIDSPPCRPCLEEVLSQYENIAGSGATRALAPDEISVIERAFALDQPDPEND